MRDPSAQRRRRRSRSMLRTCKRDQAHQGLLILTATLRNRARYAIGFPYLELLAHRCAGSQRQDPDRGSAVCSRRRITRAATTDLGAGMLPNREFLVKVFIDASSTTQEGYLLYPFYP